MLSVSPPGIIRLVPDVPNTPVPYTFDEQHYVVVTDHYGSAKVSIRGLSPGVATVIVAARQYRVDGSAISTESLLREVVTVEVVP